VPAWLAAQEEGRSAASNDAATVLINAACAAAAS
jgi:hypothetical protein